MNESNQTQAQMTEQNSSIQEPRVLNAVAAFHNAFNHPILFSPTIPSPERCTLRINLLKEELEELEEAIANGEIIDVADAFCDIQYVLAGAILEFGLQDKFKDLFDEVQRSNMSKACSTIQEAELTVEHFQRQGQDCYYEPKDDKYIVLRKSDGKLLKSINYSSADLTPILSPEQYI